MKPLRVLAFFVSLLLLGNVGFGQVSVQLDIKRRILIAHEAIMATVTITNLSGGDLTLEDTPELQWFGFQVNGAGESIVAPRNANYGVEPLTLRAGETKRRTVNLHELYQFGDYGLFTIRATIHVAGMKRYFTSRPLHVEVTEGKMVWQQPAGVPNHLKNGGHVHTFTLLAHNQNDTRMLYVRVEDRDSGLVFCTYPVGRLIDNVPPQAEFDLGNNLYVLQLVGTKSYVLTKIGVNGEFMGQTNYSAPKSRPTLRKLSDGTLQIIGGRRESAVAQVPVEPPAKLSDRPIGLPQ